MSPASDSPPDQVASSGPGQKTRRASVRPLVRADIPAIADLHHAIMSPRKRAPDSYDNASEIDVARFPMTALIPVTP